MRLGLFLATVLAGSLGASAAAAYCRTTTCNPKKYDCGTDENGCNATGAPISWRSLPIKYRFSATGTTKLDNDAAFDAVRAAFQRWTDVQCSNGKRTSLRFEEGAKITTDKPLQEGVRGKEYFGIYFRDDSWPYDASATKGGDGSLALTNVQFGEINGYIDYADIEINTTTASYSVDGGDAAPYDLEAVLVHEVGHYIGLGHSKIPDSIMVESYCRSAQRCSKGIDATRALADDDIAAVCALYPSSGIAGVRYEEPDKGCSVATDAPERRPGGRGAVFVVAAAAVAVAFRMRRRRVR